MREIKQAGLLRSYGHFLFEFVAGLQKVSLGAAADGAEPGQKQREEYENDVVREFRPADVETVNGLGKEKVESQTGEYDCKNPGPDPGIPYRYDDGQKEEREFHIVEVRAFEKKTDPQSNRNGQNCKTVALNHGRDVRR
ncbi:MAG: hypothetical protein ABR880_18765 [Candidatus Sulfotelmatobacter sp.]